ncbi:MAG: hypothetical protein AVDCRST_MAG49-1741 [uncultured Thermomicrobiales bacterium]|uniref:Response regulatory domain-containing protein n=1 Tax=uncultured Thermomicrobiales bacterium TaxID=1645740 RepID=A0A6J4UIH2_9BACT|nr:MAG: hypothetical protein AVDCRST_MAG49-1741 [uncultured Thermomicrobiales bacterium]
MNDGTHADHPTGDDDVRGLDASLPAGTTGDAAASLEIQLVTLHGIVAPRRGPKSVLVVDDEWGMADALAELLWEEGYASRSVYDGLEALVAVDRDRPDLALVDLRIPLHDGVKVAHRLRELGIPVIMMSALDRPRRLEADVPFVAKPLDVTDLFRLVADQVGPGV